MGTDFIINQEEQKHHREVSALLQSAFAKGQSETSTEHLLVDQLRQSPDFIRELLLVAQINGIVVGYILLTKVIIRNEGSSFVSLALAPVAVLPEYQRRGIGSALIRTAHDRAKALGFTSIVLIGHAEYYPRFGYKKASDFDILFPFDVPEENALVLELEEGALKNIRGTVHYLDAFLSL